LKEDDIFDLLSHIVCDGDSSIPKILQGYEGGEKIQVANDPGHYQKNFMRALKDIFGGQKYKGFPYRIGKFYMRCLKRAEEQVSGHDEESVKERKEIFDQLWKHAFEHYTRETCPNECPCNQFYSGEGGEKLVEADVFAANALSSLIDAENDVEDFEQNVEADDGMVKEVMEEEATSRDRNNPNVKIRREAKRWLNQQNQKEAKFIALMKPLFLDAGRTAGNVLFGLNTCLSECSNFRRLVFCRKDRFYYSSYEARSLISAVLENTTRADLFKRLFDHFGLVLGDDDAKSIQKLEQQDKLKEKHGERKASLDYKMRQAELAKKRIESNAEAKQASATKRADRSYKSFDKKKGFEPIFVKKKGSASQGDLEAQYNQGMTGINKCTLCQKFYKRSHKCRQATGSNDENFGLQQKSRNKKKRSRSAGKVESLDEEEDNSSTKNPVRRSARQRTKSVSMKEQSVANILELSDDSDISSEWESVPDEGIDYTKPNRYGQNKYGKIKGG
jgi:hypothetical protein